MTMTTSSTASIGVRPTAVVLAAGSGRRFGSAKQLALLEGIPLVRHAVDAVAQIELVERVLVVAGAHVQETRAALAGTRAEVVACADHAQGISASLRCGVAAAAGAPWVLITLADEPLLPAAAVRAVAQAALAAPHGTEAVRATWDGRPGHPVALAASLTPAIEALRGDDGARAILQGQRVLEVECGHLGAVTDVDAPADLEYLGRPGSPAGPSTPADA
ncbi:unannotated protein [freshwater metagenome]|uniref:Unannotated protein n=1 Tax=freshwater metagenome TaxID=449393 RepID=A0A6J7JDI1_9ZZZZ|nr:NTP transferase domain-containing protein [Actinomycetota bacterium]